MCGITGIAFANTSLLESIQAMSNSLHHRGPDDQGSWIDTDAGIALAHQRLSIVDLSFAGHQPMHSKDGRYCLALNGEIYNYREIKKTLLNLGCLFNGHADTEVLLAAISEWGLESTLEKIVGMFAFALWDKKEKTLYLARDRFGEKPLYYGRIKNSLIFASELKALKHFPLWEGNIDPHAITTYLRCGYIPAPHSIFKNIYKLLPGKYLKATGSHQEEITYWSATKTAEKSTGSLTKISLQEAAEQLEEKLKKTIKLQMHADVPCGAFLSGGIDSSLIAALAQSQSTQAIKTFTIGFEEQAYNEAPFAKKIAEHLHTDHIEYSLSTQDALDIIPLIPHLYDEPFADSSQIPTYLVSKLAKKKVSVCLSGDGGDEIFCGYKRYWMANRFQKKLRHFPLGTQKILGGILKHISPYSPKNYAQKLERLSQLLLNATDERKLNQMLMSAIPNPTKLLSFQNQEYLSTQEFPHNLEKNFISYMMLNDTLTYLPDDILVKVDRASMASALETRAPFLDHQLFEFAWTLPLDYKLHNKNGKYILRKILSRHIPSSLFERPKVGFGIPLGTWLRGPLKAWAENLLHPSLIKSQGYLDPKAVQTLWQAHLSGKYNHQAALWNILMLNHWLLSA